MTEQVISLVIPFHSTEESRQHIFKWVMRRWYALFGDEWEVCTAGSQPGEPFNRSEARNRAFEASCGDIIVLSDADTCCRPETVRAAIKKVEDGAPWVVAHDRYYSLTQEYTRQLVLQKPTIELSPPYEADWVMKERSMAGVIVMPRKAWEHVNGYDERFQLWGYEDSAFAVKMDNLWGLHQRVPGAMLHLWHDRGKGDLRADFSQPNIEYNRALYEEICRETQEKRSHEIQGDQHGLQCSLFF